MRSTAAALITIVLAGGLSAGCAPTLQASNERGGTVTQSQLWPGPGRARAMAMASDYCSHYGAVPHLASEDLGWLWSDTIAFDCVN